MNRLAHYHIGGNFYFADDDRLVAWNKERFVNVSPEKSTLQEREDLTECNSNGNVRKEHSLLPTYHRHML